MISPKNEKCGKPVLLRWMFEQSGKKTVTPWKLLNPVEMFETIQ